MKRTDFIILLFLFSIINGAEWSNSATFSFANKAGNTNISEVSYTVGFSTSSYFTKCFKNYFGVLPTQIEVEADKEE